GFVHVADLDGDGDLDLILPLRAASAIAWYENRKGSPLVWTARTLADGITGACFVAAGDLDRDGDVDVLSAGFVSRDGRIPWHENRGGQFALLTTNTAPASIVAGQPDDVLRVDMTHRGRFYGAPSGLDHDEELATLELGLDDGTGAPM